jgi:hypothetical protein
MRFSAFLPIAILLASVFRLPAQEALPLKDLSDWNQNSGTNWQIAGDVQASLTKDEQMTAAKGTGVLVNLPTKKSRANLLSTREYGDVDVSFDFMMARHSNSGFYLQGRYEVQLLDSWGVQHPGFGDCGGIYARRRWNPQEELFDGVAPRVNACLAPGLWQHMEIAFQAPRFDASGKKTANARLLKVVLNGMVIHENLELTGPTGGPISEKEAATGPFMIQGDHGPVAFRGFQITDRRGAPITVSKPFSYQVINGAFRSQEAFAGKKADLEGSTNQLSWEVAKRDNEFAIVFTGEINVPEPGQHRITLHNSGRSSIKMNGKEVLADDWSSWNRPRTLTLDLPAGTNSLTLTVYKMDTWLQPYLALWVEGPKARAVALHSKSATLAVTPPDPIFLNAPEPKVFRSFMDIAPNGSEKKRVVHAIQVGDPERLHYTYDLDNGSVPQIWKGDFLDVSPMWDDRGDGSSRPRGAVLALSDASAIVPESDIWNTQASGDAPAEGFRPLGYDLDEKGLPIFRYTLNGMEVEDRLRVMDGKYLHRTLDCRNAPAGYVCRIALATIISQTDKNTWEINGKKYFIQVPEGVKPVLRQSKGMAVLYVPLGTKVEYDIMW